MDYRGLCEWAQIANATGFAIAFAVTLYRRKRMWLLPVLLVGFVAISWLTYKLIERQPPDPDTILVGAPDGVGRARAMVTRTNDDHLRVEVEVWQLGQPPRVREVLVLEGRSRLAEDLDLVWEPDAQAVRLEERSFETETGTKTIRRIARSGQ